MAGLDTMYLHQALKEPGRDKFIEAMNKEWEDQDKNGNIELIPISQVPKGETVLPTV